MKKGIKELKPNRKSKTYLTNTIEDYNLLRAELYSAATTGKNVIRIKGRVITLGKAQITLEFMAQNLKKPKPQKYWKTNQAVEIKYILEYHKKTRLVRAYIILDGVLTSNYLEVLPHEENKKLSKKLNQEAQEIYKEYFLKK